MEYFDKHLVLITFISSDNIRIVVGQTNGINVK